MVRLAEADIVVAAQQRQQESGGGGRQRRQVSRSAGPALQSPARQGTTAQPLPTAKHVTAAATASPAAPTRGADGRSAQHREAPISTALPSNLPASSSHTLSWTPADFGDDEEYLRGAAAAQRKGAAGVTTTAAPVPKSQANDPPSAVVNETGLEASYVSLARFRAQQAGRLGQSADNVAQAADTTSLPPASPAAIEGCLQREPRGRQLSFEIHSTWGDRHYVGLTGIDIYTAPDGKRLTDFAGITADPLGLTADMGHANDPRVITNLLDGVNRTKDVMHMWLAPWLGRNHRHLVQVDLRSETTIAAIRLWNYNESRTHSHRGVRELSIALDGALIFRGEIRQAPGTLQLDDPDTFGELLLFSDSPSVLAAMEDSDTALMAEAQAVDEALLHESLSLSYAAWQAAQRRPTTAGPAEEADGDGGSQLGFSQMGAKAQSGEKILLTSDESAVKRQTRGRPTEVHDTDEVWRSVDGVQAPAVERLPAKEPLADASRMSPVLVDTAVLSHRVQRIVFDFRSTWGDPHYLGLTGLQLLDAGWY